MGERAKPFIPSRGAGSNRRDKFSPEKQEAIEYICAERTRSSGRTHLIGECKRMNHACYMCQDAADASLPTSGSGAGK